MMLQWRQLFRGAIQRVGFDVRRYPPIVPTTHAERRARLLEHNKITVVFDVGANEGQYAAEVRSAGYVGAIISFEPLSAAFHKLSSKTSGDSLWKARNVAVGDHEGSVTINVAENSVSSSVLAMKESHLVAAPQSRFVRCETVSMISLDSEFANHASSNDRVAVKMDVQGYEAAVLAGMRNSIARVQILELELSLIELYAGELTFRPMLELLDREGFRLVGLDPGLVDPDNGHVLQVDGLFVREGPRT